MARAKRTVRTENIESISADQKLAFVRHALHESGDADVTLDLDEWMDEYFVLPRETSSEFGRWRTDRFPPIRRIAKCLSPSSIAQEIIVAKGAQLFLTTLGIGWQLYSADCDPGPFQYLQRTKDDAKDYSEQKLKAFIKACKRVENTLGEGKPKRFANAWNMKAYPGGFISLTGANTSSELRARSIGKAHPDEEDTYEMNVSKEGAPIELLRKRMVNFPNRKMLRTSTPVLKELSTIWPAWEAGSQERYYVPCPHCNPRADDAEFMFWYEWEQIQWCKKLDPLTDLPTEIFLECPNCAGKIDDGEHKKWMLDDGDWFSEKLGSRQRVGDVLKPSFHISSLYSPPGFFSWRDAVAEWFAYDRSKDLDKLQVFINQTLANTFYLQGSEISYSYLESRRESYAGNLGRWDVPNGVYCLTAGADVQDDRIEVEVVGWGAMDESWSVDYVVLIGDTALMGNRLGLNDDGQPSVWKLLHDYLSKKWVHECGAELPVEVSMIDSGHMTDQVHTFCRYREGMRVFPIKGDDGQGKGGWDRSKRRHEKYGTWLYWAHTFHLKNVLYHRLKIADPGPGYCHFPKKSIYGKKYFQGLTCERLRTKTVAGKQKLYWETPSGARNEPTDCRSYATVARDIYQVDIEGRARQGLQKLFPPAGTASGIIKPIRKKPKGHPGL